MGLPDYDEPCRVQARRPAELNSKPSAGKMKKHDKEGAIVKIHRGL